MQVRYIGELEYRMEILGGQGGVDWWNVVKIDIILHSIQVNRCAQCQLRCNFIISVLKVFQDENESIRSFFLFLSQIIARMNWSMASRVSFTSWHVSKLQSRPIEMRAAAKHALPILPLLPLFSFLSFWKNKMEEQGRCSNPRIRGV